MIFNYQKYKNSYLIIVLLKNSNFFRERFLYYYKILCKFLLKKMNSTREFT